MPVFFIDIQFVAQPPCQAEAADKAVDESVLCDLVFAVNNLQDQSALRLFQPLNQFLVAGFGFCFQLRCRQCFIKIVIYSALSSSFIVFASSAAQRYTTEVSGKLLKDNSIISSIFV